MTTSFMKKIQNILQQEKNQSQIFLFGHYIRNNIPNRYTGYRLFRREKATMLLKFLQRKNIHPQSRGQTIWYRHFYRNGQDDPRREDLEIQC